MHNYSNRIIELIVKELSINLLSRWNNCCLGNFDARSLRWNGGSIAFEGMQVAFL